MFSILLLLTILIGCVQSQTELTLPPLPYAYNAIEPVLSEQLMHLHHDKHFQTYTTKTNAALKAIVEDKKSPDQLKQLAKEPIELIVTHLQHLPELYHLALRHNGGGYINHKLFFSMIKTPTTTAAENKPTGPVLEAIEKNFGSFDKFKEMFTNASVNLFGSGWVWLYIDAQTKQLVLNFTANQDNPIMFDKNHVVLLGIDLWEHAYYPVYENRRNEYVDNFWRIINWPFVAKLYTEGSTKRADL
jgi:Fe-Mn family superoxide dismutase